MNSLFLVSFVLLCQHFLSSFLSIRSFTFSLWLNPVLFPSPLTQADEFPGEEERADGEENERDEDGGGESRPLSRRLGRRRRRRLLHQKRLRIRFAGPQRRNQTHSKGFRLERITVFLVAFVS